RTAGYGPVRPVVWEGRSREASPYPDQATTSFALFQAGGAYGLSYCFEQTGGNYALLFMIGAAAITAALAVDLVVGLLGDRARS
ncbi:hypothetical protein AAFX91_30610, partial [Bradyrhizobium sp. 31Argb]